MDKLGIAPLTPPYPPDVAEMLARWMPPGAAAVPPLALFRTLVRHPALAERLRPLGAFLLNRGTLPVRARELVILRTCARAGAEYEWGVHAAAFAAAAGLDEAALAATRAARPGAPLAPADLELCRLVDELHDTGALADELAAALAARYGDEQRLELLVLAGFYHLISFVANGARVEPEPWARRWPAPACDATER
jgi:4-carboxymuconolactone decarboxylase